MRHLLLVPAALLMVGAIMAHVDGNLMWVLHATVAGALVAEWEFHA